MYQDTNNANFRVLHHSDDILVVQTHGADDDGNHATNHKTCDAESSNHDISMSTPTPSYGRFNLGLHVSDDPKQVLLNRAQLLSQLNQYLVKQTKNRHNTTAQIKSIHWLNQIHSNKVLNIDEPAYHYSMPLSLLPANADAQIAMQAYKALAIMTADCVPIVLYHPITKQIAAIHAGWKGLANGVIAKTMHELNLQQAQTSIKSIPKTTTNLTEQTWRAWIGACICKNCYEVSTDVLYQSLQDCHTIFPELNTEQLRLQAVKAHVTDPNKAWLDLVAITMAQLDSLGIEVVKNTEVQDADSNLHNKASHRFGGNNSPQGYCYDSHALACSYGNGRYYSYRRMTHQKRLHTGRMALLIARIS